ncbi:MAG: tRNA threonylcarbamoyladenosine dehydratase [Oscillospiraceae bacterium]|nr:tRNA threonylcarbamoyladenosine dehydratase [Oscillospiraceae bacterium]
MNESFSRTEALIGEAPCERLKCSRVIVFGAGGVGSAVIEAIARAGVGNISIVDGDTVARSNINRQLIALESTVGLPKAEVARDRALDINPAASVTAHNIFYNADTADGFELSAYDYVIDAIDMVTSKLLLIERCAAAGVPIICAMGAGNKLDPSRFRVADINKTSGCPLARVIRKELRQRGIKKLDVVFSDEEPRTPVTPVESAGGRNPPGSISFVPPVAGFVMAGYVIKKLVGIE